MKEFAMFCRLLLPLCIIGVALNASDDSSPKSYPLWDNHESVAEYANKVNLPPTKNIDLGEGVKLDLVLIPAGKFVMGTPEWEKPIVGQVMLGIGGFVLIALVAVVFIRVRKKHSRPQYSRGYLLLMMLAALFCVWGGALWWEMSRYNIDENEYPAHEVTLTKPFYMGKYDVTQQQYQQIMGNNPSGFRGKDNPVEQVSWNDAQEFCKRVGGRLKITFRLPTEAEWEYACRAGMTTEYYFDSSLKRVAWYDANSNNTTHPVGQKEPNRLGVYDMYGNVWQWCQDWYEVYKVDPVKDPQGPKQGTHGVIRGSSWYDGPKDCRSAAQRCGPPTHDYSCYNLGFRVVVVIVPQ